MNVNESSSIAILIYFISRHVFKTRPNSARAPLAFPVTYFPTGTELKYKQTTVLDKSGHGCVMKSKLRESQHIDICKPINLLNKKWSDKNPPQTTKQNI